MAKWLMSWMEDGLDCQIQGILIKERVGSTQSSYGQLEVTSLSYKFLGVLSVFINKVDMGMEDTGDVQWGEVTDTLEVPSGSERSQQAGKMTGCNAQQRQVLCCNRVTYTLLQAVVSWLKSFALKDFSWWTR